MNEQTETFLTGSVPELETHSAVVQVHGLGEKVDADGCLVCGVERVVHEARDDAGLAHALVAQEHQLVPCQWALAWCRVCCHSFCCFF